MSESERRGSDQTVLVIGGGIGGLAAAIGLDERGFDVAVYEQATALREVGAGLVVWRNGLEALDRLGGHDPVVQAGARIARNEFWTPDGTILSTVEAEELLPSDTDVPPGVVLHRATLQEHLRARVPDEVVHLDHECVGVEQDGARVVAQFAGGNEVTGDCLIGADGIHSVVRSSLHGEGDLRASGVEIWRGVTEFDHSISTGDTIIQVLGKGRRFVALPMGDGRVYWVVSTRDLVGWEPPAAAAKARLVGVFEGWPAPVPGLIESTSAEALLWDEAVDRPLLDEWGRGPVTLLGDAAHLTLPFVGQGASQALEDAVWLTRYLDRKPDIPAAFRAYEAHRTDRTAMIVKTGRRLGRLWHLQHPIAVGARNLLMKLGPDRIFGRAFKRNTLADL